ncbi:MAG: hypothetical protein GX996_06110 [Firmicutes bacterium]|nr:hypothetical protein [Bacillota bacterium]
MPWIISAAVLWLFIIVFLRSQVGKHWSAAIWAVVVGYFLNDTFITYGFYAFHESLYPFHNIPLGYLIGLGGIGIIIICFLPEEKLWQLPYLILFSLIFTALEIFAVEQEYIVYLQWSTFYSFSYKLIAFIVIAWLSNLTVKRRKRYFDFR